MIRSVGMYATLNRLSTSPSPVVADSQMLAPDLYGRRDFGRDDGDTINHWTLLIITAQGCRGCSAAIAAWERAIDAPTSVLIRLATAEPQALEIEVVERLRSRGANVALWTIRDVSQFRIRTGVKLVPMAMLIDSDARVRIVASGVPSEPIRHAFRRIVTGPELDATPALFEHNSETDWIEGPPRRLPPTLAQ